MVQSTETLWVMGKGLDLSLSMEKFLNSFEQGNDMIISVTSGGIQGLF